MAEIRNILFPTDFSEQSNKAFPYAAALARAFGAKITLLHVSELEESDPANPEHRFPALDAFEGETEKVVIRGHAPYKDILDVSRSRGCDLVVMATHGRSELAQFFLGRSVSEDVSEFSTVPVYIVPIKHLTDGAEPGMIGEIIVSGGAARAHAELFARKFSAQLTEIEGERDADRIVKVANERKADLIIIESERDDSLREEFAGKFADRVIQNAECPVMTVRA